MSAEPIRIVLISPDIAWRTELGAHLRQHSFDLVGEVARPSLALAVCRERYPTLAIIDTRLPETEVLTLCQELQAECPALKLVLVTEAEADQQLAALQTGVSGCLGRDFPIKDWPGLLNFVSRGGAVFNRTRIVSALARASPASIESDVVTVGPLRIDLAHWRVTRHGRRICLTPREFALLASLARHAGQVVPFQQLLNEVLDYEPDAGSPAELRLYISRLRRKLGDDPAAPTFIITERGLGYRLRSHEQWRQVGQLD